MDDDYYRYPVGSPEHDAAYEKYFIAMGGIGFAIPGDPKASYEVDNAAELAYARGYDGWYESLYQQHVEERAQWWRARGVQLAEDLLDHPGAGWGRNCRAPRLGNPAGRRTIRGSWTTSLLANCSRVRSTSVPSGRRFQ